MGSPVRILCLADDRAFPVDSGFRIRLSHVLEGLAVVGKVDFYAVVPKSADVLPEVPLSALALETTGVSVAHYERGPRAVARWLTSGLPRSPVLRDWRAARIELPRWLDGRRYDLVWFGHTDVALMLGDLIDARVRVLDVDNLGGEMIRHRRERVGAAASRGGGRTHGGRIHRRLIRMAADMLDERRWDRLNVRLARDLDAFVVCSELDRSRVRVPASVVPNTYPVPTTPACGVPGAVFTMVGALWYEPNLDAAHWFAEAVMPLVRATIPGATFRLVGQIGSDVDLAGLHENPHVEVVGPVADVNQELRRASVIVVPVRFGGGTRIKLLEAFAHQIPAVSTSVGCEGLEAVDDEHLLVADSAPAFAAACIRLSTDDALRGRLAGNAAALFKRRFHPDAVHDIVIDVAHKSLNASTSQ